MAANHSLLKKTSRVYHTRIRKLPQWLYEMSRALRALARRECPDVLVTSLDLCSHNAVKGIFACEPIFYSRLLPQRAKFIMGWGQKKSGKRIAELKHVAQEHFIVEDGFLRSATRYGASCSLVIDRNGIFYDSNSESKLFEHLDAPLTPQDELRAKGIIENWRYHRVSKYNDAPDFQGILPKDFILVIDQVANDLSVGYGSRGQVAFDTMLETALKNHPDQKILLKVHPDSLSDPTKRHFDLEKLQDNPQIVIVADACNIVSLLEASRAVYTVTSQVGFEALIWGKPVYCFGKPFYSGLGLTIDYGWDGGKRGAKSLEHLVFATLVAYSRYWNPVREEECEVEDIIALIGANCRIFHQTPHHIHAVGFSRWKQRFIKKFLPAQQFTFLKKNQSPPDNSHVLIWGRSTIKNPEIYKSILSIEDGFIRSSGLGADLIRPLSLCVDDRGIYFDSTRTSRIENFIQEHHFLDCERREGRALKEALLKAGVNKYNLDRQAWVPPHTQENIILVVGQVEGDASIRYGSPKIKTNLELVQNVRQNHPSAYVIYKPHPDVAAGLRLEVSRLEEIKGFCDEVIGDCDTIALFAQVDEVHTITSLMGMEALLRGIKVTCYGQPFYSGWGLTSDVYPCERRKKKISIDQLVFAALIAYPRYFDYKSNMFMNADDAIWHIENEKKTAHKRLFVLRKALRFLLVCYNKHIKKA